MPDEVSQTDNQRVLESVRVQFSRELRDLAEKLRAVATEDSDFDERARLERSVDRGLEPDAAWKLAEHGREIESRNVERMRWRSAIGRLVHSAIRAGVRTGDTALDAELLRIAAEPAEKYENECWGFATVAWGLVNVFDAEVGGLPTARQIPAVADLIADLWEKSAGAPNAGPGSEPAPLPAATAETGKGTPIPNEGWEGRALARLAEVGARINISTLAAELGVSRATLYRSLRFKSALKIARNASRADRLNRPKHARAAVDDAIDRERSRR